MTIANQSLLIQGLGPGVWPIEGSVSLDDRTIEALQAKWHRWLSIRYGGLRPQFQDILQDTAVDLVQYLQRRVGEEPSAEDIEAIGATILRRRVADCFRGEVSRWAELSIDELSSDIKEADLSDAAVYADLLRLVIGKLASMDRRDSALLISDELGPELERALPASARQRLHRLRQRLKQDLKDDYGIDVGDALGE